MVAEHLLENCNQKRYDYSFLKFL